MKWASALSQQAATADAVREAVAVLRADLGVAAPDLVLAFASPHHGGDYERIPELVARELPGALLCGCTGGGIIGSGHEVEGGPALSLTAASLPGVDLVPLYFAPDATSSEDDDDEDEERAPDPSAWRARVGVPPEREPGFLLLPDPFTCDVQALITALDAAYPSSPKVGGLASGGVRPGQNALFLADDAVGAGAVGVALHGDVAVDTIVAQGCRPIGVPCAVTRCEENAIIELDGKPALEVVRSLYESLPPADRELLRHSLFLGLEMREGSIEFREGELLVRNIIGSVPEAGAIVVAAHVHTYQVVQFLLRDAATATHDLERQLDAYGRSGASAPAGALLFSCLGRGEGLFGRADHDTDLFHQRVGRVPLGGFFCNGEIGPVGGSTFLHGYTSSFGLFRARAS
jgi:small ligand-binding sensory domain FIST